MEKKKYDVEFHGTSFFALVPLLLFVVFCILFFVVFKTFDMMHLCMGGYAVSYTHLLCWCIGKAASEIKEFYTLPVGCELLQHDSIAVNTIVKNKTGEVSSCDVPFSADLAQFSADYLQLTHEVAESCENHDLPGSMVIGTSAILDTEIDGAVGMNSGIFNNPFIIWGKYHKGLLDVYKRQLLAVQEAGLRG